jgi:hypothetical protein
VARQRRGRTQVAQTVNAPEISDTQAPQTNSRNTTTNTGERKMAGGLTADQIAQLLGSTRSKGQYVVYLNEFLDSEEGGVCANEQWVAIKDKKASTIKQGFENAKDKKDARDDAQFVKVITNDDKVFLINLKVAGMADEAAPEEEAA